MISRGTVGGRPAGERLFRNLCHHPPSHGFAILLPFLLLPLPSPRPAAAVDANNDVIPRDAQAVSVETPRPT